MPKVFISHSIKDREFVEREIITLLQNHQIETWYSSQSIQTAEEWERSIHRGLNSCDWFLVVMSPHSAKSEWVRAEVFWAASKRRGRIIPVLLEECDPTDFHLMLFQIQYLDFRHNIDVARQKLLAVLSVDRETQRISELDSVRKNPQPSTKLKQEIITKSDLATMNIEELKRYIVELDGRIYWSMRGLERNSLMAAKKEAENELHSRLSN